MLPSLVIIVGVFDCEWKILMMDWFVYIVKCKDASLYTGISTDVTARIAVHNAGKGAKYTRGRLPVKLVYLEEQDTRSAALKRELQIKAMKTADKHRLIK